MGATSESLIFDDGSAVVTALEIIIIVFLTIVLFDLRNRIKRISDSIRLMIFNYNKILLLVNELNELKVNLNGEKNHIASINNLEKFAERHMEFKELYWKIENIYRRVKPNF